MKLKRNKEKSKLFTHNTPEIFYTFDNLTRIFNYEEFMTVNSGDVYFVDMKHYRYLDVFDVVKNIASKASETIAVPLIFSKNTRGNAIARLLKLTKRLNVISENPDTEISITFKELENAIDANMNRDKSSGHPSICILYDLCDVIRSMNELSKLKQIFTKWGENHNCIFVCPINPAEIYKNTDFNTFYRMFKSKDLNNEYDNGYFEISKDIVK